MEETARGNICVSCSSWNLYFMSFSIIYIVHVFFCPWLLCFIGKGLIHHMQSLLTIKEKLDPHLSCNNSFSWQWGVLYFMFYEFYGEQGWRNGESAHFHQCVPGSIPGPGGRFSKAPETFRARKAIAKSRTLRVRGCFSSIF